jgi:hypothetical protein
MSVFIGFSGAPAGTSPGGSITISAGQIVGRSPTETGSGAASGKSLGNGIGWSGGQVVATTQMSVTADTSGIRLVGDAATPGGSKYYGTDAGGNRGFWALPAGSGSTDLGVTTAANQLTVTSSSGSSAVLPAATASLAGVMTSTDKAKLDGIAASATANSTDATLLNRANHTGTQAASTISDFAAAARTQIQGAVVAGTNITATTSGSGASAVTTLAAASTNISTTRNTTSVTVASSTGTSGSITAATASLAGVMTSTDKTKLDGIAAGATANSTDASLLNRANHTGTQGAATISDLAANTRMQVQSMLVAGTNVSLTVSGSGDSMQIIVAATTGGSGSTDLGVTTAANQLTVTSSSGASAVLPAATASLAGVMTSTDKSKLDGIAAGATANSTDAALLNRANHTGTQGSATISDFAAAVRAQIEAALVAGTNMSITGSGAGATRQLTLAAATSGSSSGGDPILTFRASQLIPATTNGAGVDSQETTTGGSVNRDYLTFPAGVNRYAWLELAVPTGWNSGFEYRLIWRSLAVSGTVQWECAARAFSDGNDETSAPGSGTLVADAAAGYGSATMITPWSTAVSPGGAVLDGNPMMIRIGRLGASTAPLDNLSNTAFLHMVQIRKVSDT